VDPKLAPVTQEMLKAGGIIWSGDDQDLLDAGEHQGGEGVVDHRLVVDGQQLLARDHRQGIETGAGASGKNNAFHVNLQGTYSTKENEILQNTPSYLNT